MPSISIQFHALPDELEAMTFDWCQKFELKMAAQKFSPFEIHLIGANDLGEVFKDTSFRRLAFSTNKFFGAGRNNYDFLNKNPECLTLDIGRLGTEWLEESRLSCSCSDKSVYLVWQRIARSLKKETQAGARAVNPVTKTSSVARNHRFTIGAKESFDAGVQIRPMAGSCYFEL